MKSVPVKIESIRIDGGTQMRERIHTDTVDDYAESYKDGAKMPPLDVFFDGKEYWLGNGFHRYHAVRKIGWKEVDCFIHKGTLREAILFAAGCNDSNGLRRSPADKHAAVTTLLNDPEWVTKSDIWIAEVAKVSQWLVAECRKKHTLASKPPKLPGSQTGTSAKSAERRTGRDGKKYPAKHKTTKKLDLHVAPIDADEPPKKLKIAVQDIGATVGNHRAKALIDSGVEVVDKYADDRRFARMLAELVEAGRKMTMNAIDKASVIYALNKIANESAEAVEEAEAVA